ncbi:MAG: hypothetical protein HFG80_08780 [Eubacterium sp.]|nr:hypothetical protein [Eubacterium sp.]
MKQKIWETSAEKDGGLSFTPCCCICFPVRADSLNVTTAAYASILGGGVTASSLLVFSAIGGFVGIPIFGRYDFCSFNRLAVPLVIGIRIISLLLIPIMLGIAGEANGNIGFRNVFIIFGTLSLISFIVSVLLKDRCIGKE